MYGENQEGERQENYTTHTRSISRRKSLACRSRSRFFVTSRSEFFMPLAVVLECVIILVARKGGTQSLGDKSS